jgi:HSP20 family molecular chaperone IbpA
MSFSSFQASPHNFHTLTIPFPPSLRFPHYQTDVHLALDDARVLSITAQRHPNPTSTSSSSSSNSNDPPHQQIVHINRKYILPKFANPKDMRADLIDGVLYIQVFKMGEWLASVKRRRMG